MARVIQITQSDIENLRTRLRQDPSHLSSRVHKTEAYQTACYDVFRILNLQIENWISEVTKDQ